MRVWLCLIPLVVSSPSQAQVISCPLESPTSIKPVKDYALALRNMIIADNEKCKTLAERMKEQQEAILSSATALQAAEKNGNIDQATLQTTGTQVVNFGKLVSNSLEHRRECFDRMEDFSDYFVAFAGLVAGISRQMLVIGDPNSMLISAGAQVVTESLLSLAQWMKEADLDMDKVDSRDLFVKQFCGYYRLRAVISSLKYDRDHADLLYLEAKKAKTAFDDLDFVPTSTHEACLTKKTDQRTLTYLMDLEEVRACNTLGALTKEGAKLNVFDRVTLYGQSFASEQKDEIVDLQIGAYEQGVKRYTAPQGDDKRCKESLVKLVELANDVLQTIYDANQEVVDVDPKQLATYHTLRNQVVQTQARASLASELNEPRSKRYIQDLDILSNEIEQELFETRTRFWIFKRKSPALQHLEATLDIAERNIKRYEQYEKKVKAVLEDKETAQCASMANAYQKLDAAVNDSAFRRFVCTDSIAKVLDPYAYSDIYTHCFGEAPPETCQTRARRMGGRKVAAKVKACRRTKAAAPPVAISRTKEVEWDAVRSDLRDWLDQNCSVPMNLTGNLGAL